VKDGVSVVGTVRYGDGTPARVSVHSTPSLDLNGHWCHCDTREDGSYELYYQPRSRFFVVVGRPFHGRVGNALASREFANPETGVLRCDFVLAEVPTKKTEVGVRTSALSNASVRGRLLDAAGRDAAWAVTLKLVDASEGGPERQPIARDGSFKFDGLARGKYVLNGRAGSAPAQSIATFELAEGQQLDLGDVSTRPLTALRIAFERVDGSAWRGPPPNVQLVDAAGSRVGARTEAMAGGVRLEAEPGVYHVHVQDVDLLAEPRRVELTAGVESTVRVRVAIGRSRRLVWNGDGAYKTQPDEVLHVTVRTSDGAVVVQQDIAEPYPDLRGFRYWYLDRVFAFGRYEVEAHTDSGQRFRGTIDVREDVEDPTRVDVPRTVQ
jgi:hypothetical protein